ncbi:MAG: Calx-beta domain-containing protein [Bacteroidales bacterium]
MKNILKIGYSFLIATLFMVSCDSDDYKGYSTIDPTNPTITVSEIPSSINFIEKDSVFTFKLTLSTPQVVDIAVYAKQIDKIVEGIAEEGKDFTILNDGGKITFAAGSTEAQLKIKVLADNLQEPTEIFNIQIGDETTANATLTPVVVKFTIANYSVDALSVDMEWTTNIQDVIGADLDPEEVVDLRMLIIDSNDNIVEVVDGSSFESYLEFNTLANGVYRIATDIYSTIDAGDLNVPITLSLSLNFNQPGVYNDYLLSYDDIMTNEFVCGGYRVYLASVEKTGSSSYTITEDIEVPSNVLVGEWLGIDTEEEYDSQVVVFQGCTSMIKGLAFEWLEDFWGEEIVAGGAVEITIDPATKSFIIADQYYLTTVYKGVEYPYTIVGDGTYDNSGEYLTMTVNYELFQDGWSPSQWCVDNGYMTSNIFHATLTLDPAGLSATKGNKIKVKLPVKPIR